MLNTTLTKTILHTTDKYVKSLEKWWMTTILDMIEFFPRDHEDRTKVLESFSYINIKEKNTILVKIISIDNQKTANWKLLTKVIIEDKNQFLSECVFFNRKYLSTSLKNYIWKQVIVSWKPKYEYWRLSFVSPEIDTDLSKSWWEIVPIYSDFNYIPGTWFASKIHNLKQYFSEINETLPQVILEKYNFMPKKEAYYNIHFPKSKTLLEQAKYRLAYEELYNINYTSLEKKHSLQLNTTWKSIAIKLNPDRVKNILEKLPFPLTDHQKISLFQILKDMEKTHSMQRLLEWDVWTWKTIVAFVSIVHAILESQKNKIQAAIMAPTEILARQHYEWLKDMFLEFWLSSELLVWSTTKKQKESIKAWLSIWDINVIIWTHALLQEDVLFKNLWYVIIDEQHRFWVKQREILESGLWNKSWLIPHNLNMTATPIPRTLALTLYWDQDLSIISQYPAWRKQIHTKVARNDGERNQIILFIKEELRKWRQVFWISPLVEESEKVDLANAINTYNFLLEEFEPYEVGLLHGKMKASEKEEIMNKFASNEIKILSSTSVVEVWVNVPNATIMCIEWAERFWLSQLHQFRWRVGRGEHQSYCYLFPTSWNPTDRLKAMEKTWNWFELAEIDLEIRWPWEVYWVRQSWVPDLKIASLTDLELISQIRDDIEECVLEVKKLT